MKPGIKFIFTKLLFFGIAVLSGFSFVKIHGISARDNAYLACFIDDESIMFKTQVVYSGDEIEAKRLAFLSNGSDADDTKGMVTDFGSSTAGGGTPNLTNDITTNTWGCVMPRDNLMLKDKDDRLPLMDSTGEFFFMTYTPIEINDKDYTMRFTIRKGYPYLDIVNKRKDEVIYRTTTLKPDMLMDALDIKWSAIESDNILDHAVTPLTFPAAPTTSDAKGTNSRNADINRAYEVQEALSEDFRNALLFLNDGEPYESVETLLETTYYLVTASNNSVGATITNAKGHSYLVRFLSNSDSPYKAYIQIEDKENRSTHKYCYKVKKGYLGCSYGEEMENGSSNVVATPQMKSKVEKHDTVWLSWEHLYFEAAVLYSEGITYSNQADLYTADELENGIVKITRSLLNGLKGILQLYGIEELVFNKGIRGSRAFVYGAYYENWSVPMTVLFLIFTSIALSLVMLSIISLVTKKQISTVSPTMRVSLMEGVQSLILSLFGLASVWWIVKLLLMLNSGFVNIWSAYVGDKTLENVGGSYSVLASIIFQFAYLIIDVYINFLYITRSLFIGALIVTSPIFIILFSYGKTGQNITKTWAKELVGHIFIQSFHAFVYGFILMASPGLRGIESLVVCSSIIPITSLLKDIFGLGLDNLAKQAGVLTASGAGAAASAVKAGANVVAKGSEAVGAGVGAFVGKRAATSRANIEFSALAGNIETQRQAARRNARNEYDERSADARAETQLFNLRQQRERDIRAGINLGADVGGSMGRSFGGGVKATGGAFNTSLGMGYEYGVREKSAITERGIDDIGRGGMDLVDGFSDAGMNSIPTNFNANAVIRPNPKPEYEYRNDRNRPHNSNSDSDGSSGRSPVGGFGGSYSFGFGGSSGGGFGSSGSNDGRSNGRGFQNHYNSHSPVNGTSKPPIDPSFGIRGNRT